MGHILVLDRILRVYVFFSPNSHSFDLSDIIHIAFIIACLVSFRSLWSSKNQNSKNHRYQAERQRAAALAQQSRTDGQGDGNRTPKNWRKMHDDFLDTLADLEGTTIGRDKSYWLQIPPHLATIDIDFLTSPNTHSDDVNVVQTREEDRRWQGDC
jgi:hypothetical protein